MSEDPTPLLRAYVLRRRLRPRSHDDVDAELWMQLGALYRDQPEWRVEALVAFASALLIRPSDRAAADALAELGRRPRVTTHDADAFDAGGSLYSEMDRIIHDPNSPPGSLDRFLRSGLERLASPEGARRVDFEPWDRSRPVFGPGRRPLGWRPEEEIAEVDWSAFSSPEKPKNEP